MPCACIGAWTCATAFAIANEGRLLVGCDRLSVLVGRNARPRLLAVSGVDSVNRRSDTSRRLERLGGLAIAMREAIWHDGSAAEWPPQVDQAVQEHVDATHVRTLAVIPLGRPPPSRVARTTALPGRPGGGRLYRRRGRNLAAAAGRGGRPRQQGFGAGVGVSATVVAAAVRPGRSGRRG